MPKTGKSLEKLVSSLEKVLGNAGNVCVESPKRLRDKITGKLREHDVVLTINEAHHHVIIAIECRDRSRWAKGWRKRGWMKSDGKQALNPDLWGRMLDLVDLFPKLTFKWVRGHAGNVFNERADTLATGAASGGDKLVDKGFSR